MGDMDNHPDYVAPFAGAWIEIEYKYAGGEFANVAPFAGAWIEMLIKMLSLSISLSRSLRGSVD